MIDSSKLIVNGIEIDEKRARQLLQWIIVTEKNNVKSKEKNDQQMILMIQKKIEEIVKCY